MGPPATQPTTDATLAASTSLRPEAVYHALRRAIINQEHPAGSVITESAVAATYGVARPTAKAAINRLGDERLVIQEPHRSARVTRFDATSVHDLYCARALVEEAALRDVARLGVVSERALDLQEQMRALASRSHLAPYAHEDIGFHRALVVSSGSPRLARMHEQLISEVELCMGRLQHFHLLHVDEIVREHDAIIDAIQLRDVELTAARIKAHILNARNRVLTQFPAEPSEASEGSSHAPQSGQDRAS